MVRQSEVFVVCIVILCAPYWSMVRLSEVLVCHMQCDGLARTIYIYGVYTVFLAGKSPNIRRIR
jgi:hypothetical protein